jgi:hypothetical protein
MSAFHPLRTLGLPAKLAEMKHLHWLLIIAVPLILVGAYWLAIDQRSGLQDWIVLGLAVGVGVAGIWSAPWRRKAKVASTAAYVPVMGVAFAAGVLFLECSTGNCL